MGFERFERTESLNASDDFVDLLAGIVIDRFEEALSRTQRNEDPRANGMP
jgi:hypothetical protein